MRVFVLILLVCLGGSVSVMAQSTPNVPATCDPDFHDVLRGKAWMEAQREVEIAETIILDPASVLDYTCFENIATHFAALTVFGNQDDRENEHTTGTSALQRFFDEVTNGITFNCTSMQSIWDDVRCDNVDAGKYFKDFESLVGSDPRSCSGSTRDDNWDAADAMLFPSTFRDVDSGGTDKLDTFLKQMTDCATSAVITTGVVLKIGDKTVTDGTCLAPGCRFNGSSCQ